MGVFDPPSIRAKIARSIRHIMPVPTMLQTQKNSSGNVVKCACLLLNFAQSSKIIKLIKSVV